MPPTSATTTPEGDPTEARETGQPVLHIPGDSGHANTETDPATVRLSGLDDALDAAREAIAQLRHQRDIADRAMATGTARLDDLARLHGEAKRTALDLQAELAETRTARARADHERDVAISARHDAEAGLRDAAAARDEARAQVEAVRERLGQADAHREAAEDRTRAAEAALAATRRRVKEAIQRAIEEAEARADRAIEQQARAAEARVADAIQQAEARTDEAIRRATADIEQRLTAAELERDRGQKLLEKARANTAAITQELEVASCRADMLQADANTLRVEAERNQADLTVMASALDDALSEAAEHAGEAAHVRTWATATRRRAAETARELAGITGRLARAEAELEQLRRERDRSEDALARLQRGYTPQTKLARALQRAADLEAQVEQAERARQAAEAAEARARRDRDEVMAKGNAESTPPEPPAVDGNTPHLIPRTELDAATTRHHEWIRLEIARLGAQERALEAVLTHLAGGSTDVLDILESARRQVRNARERNRQRIANGEALAEGGAAGP